MIRALLASTIFFVSTLALAGESVAVISGPGKVEVGELVILRSGSADPSLSEWIILDQQGRAVKEIPLTAPIGDEEPVLRYVKADEGRAVVFSSPNPGRYFVVLVAFEVIVDATYNEETMMVEVEKTVTKTTAKHIVTIGDPKPGPGPGPGPNPPQPLTGIAKEVHDAVLGEVPPSSQKNAGKVAKAFRSVASMIAAGALREPEDIIRETSSQRAEQLGNDKSNWDGWSKKVGAMLNMLSDSGELETAADHSAVWQEIARGLESVK